MEINVQELKKSLFVCRDLKASAVMLVNSVADQLDELEHDPIAIKRLAVNLRDNADEIGSAIVENTHHHTPTVDSVVNPHSTVKRK